MAGLTAGQWFSSSLSVTCGRSVVFFGYSGFLIPSPFPTKKKKKKNKNDQHDIAEMLLNVNTPITPTKFIYISKSKLFHEDYIYYV